MADVKAPEGTEDEQEILIEPEPLPMYSIQADFAQPKECDIATVNLAYQPYTVATTTNLNPCAEGLEDPVLLQEDCEKNEGVDVILNANPDDANAAGIENIAKNTNPGCCRRYSCCFPLIIITLVC